MNYLNQKLLIVVHVIKLLKSAYSEEYIYLYLWNYIISIIKH